VAPFVKQKYVKLGHGLSGFSLRPIEIVSYTTSLKNDLSSCQNTQAYEIILVYYVSYTGIVYIPAGIAPHGAVHDVTEC
jgi:hypothetical protein